MMRIRHGAATLALLAVVAMLVAPGMIRAATVEGVVFPPEYACHKTLSDGKCDGKACHDRCFKLYRGDGQCTTRPRAGCLCTYVCNPPPGHVPAPGGTRVDGGAPGPRASGWRELF